ncbi:Outer membrane protein Omp28 [Flavobacterium caeni]|uniref:Outer membrane protein Omp28 n=2 Tax=Flavobacterium caeni TaxID=490189 RepID=A0A1G5HAX2_9FLAO|nr:Outer membrane protein Omp28 [Flavobacterium caeni]
MGENKIFFALFASYNRHYYAMKFLRFFGFFAIVGCAVSCNDTNHYYAEIPVNSAPDAPPVSGQFEKNVLVEDYTGTWCGNCTRVSYGIERVLDATDRAVVVAIHNGNDPYHFDDYMPLKNLISPDHDLELPQARLNRIINWLDPDTNTQDVLNLTSNNCGLGIAMTSTVSDNNIELDVNVKFAQNFSNLKLVVYVLEDHLVYPQVNYSTYYNGVHRVLDFEHNHVLRASLTHVLGNPISGTNFDQTVTTSFSVPVPADVSNAENMSFVAMVVDANNQAINARSAYPNESQAFQENP